MPPNTKSSKASGTSNSTMREEDVNVARNVNFIPTRSVNTLGTVDEDSAVFHEENQPFDGGETVRSTKTSKSEGTSGKLSKQSNNKKKKKKKKKKGGSLRVDPAGQTVNSSDASIYSIESSRNPLTISQHTNRSSSAELIGPEKEGMFEEEESDFLLQNKNALSTRSSFATSGSSTAPGSRFETRNGTVEPAGFATNPYSDGEIYSMEECNPLKASNQTAATSSTWTPFAEKKLERTGSSTTHQMNEKLEEEESELLDDTFTFLMTAKYPLEDCLYYRKKTKKSDNDDNGGFDEEEEAMSLPSLDNDDKTGQPVDPDGLCLPFWLATFVITSQLFIYMIVIANVFQSKLPPNADIWLRMAQVFAVFVTLYTQGDFIDGIFLFTERWKGFHEITGPLKFNLSALCRILAGNVGIASTFILVMYSTEVVDLLLNFTAMEFVATLDDSAFELASKGFLGEILERKTEEIREFRYHRRTRSRRRARFLLYAFYVLLVFVAFLFVIGLQGKRSVGVDNEVYMQFDDTGIPELHGVSGVYKGCKGFRSATTRGIGYIDVSLPCPEFDKKNDTKTLPANSFVYCHIHDGWVFLPSPTDIPCEEGSYILRSFLDEDSIPSNAFDILTHSSARWVVGRPEIGGEAIMANFLVESTKQIPARFVYCNGDGLARIDKGDKDQRIFKPLKEELYPIFEAEGSDSDGKTYTSAFGQMFRPVYARKVHEIRNPDDKNYQVLFYDGLRWNRIYLNPTEFASHIGREEECYRTNDDPDCWWIFVKYFHSETSWKSNITVSLFDAISDPLLILSKSDTGTPTKGLEWYEARIVDDRVLPGQPKAAHNGLADDNDFWGSQGNDQEEFGFQCFVDVDFGCTEDETELRIDFDTDFFPDEVTLLAYFGYNETDIANFTYANRVIVNKDVMEFDIPENGLVDLRFQKPNNAHLLYSCVPKSESCIQVAIMDSFGDGVGDYELSYHEEDPLTSGGTTFQCRLYQLGPACNTTEVRFDCDSQGVLQAFPQNVTGGEVSDAKVVDDFLQNTFAVTQQPEVTFAPVDVATLEFSCADNEIKMHIEFTTDEWHMESAVALFYGQELGDVSGLATTSKMIPTTATGLFEISGDSLTALTFPTASTSYMFGTCVPVDFPCIQVAVWDEFGDGVNAPGRYNITYGTEPPATGDGNGWSCKHHQFGDGCVNTLSGFGDCVFVPFDPSRFTFDIYFDETGIVDAPPPPTAPPLMSCEADEIAMQVDVTTDGYPAETMVAAFFGQNLDTAASLTTTYLITPGFSVTTGSFFMSGGGVTALSFDQPYTSYSVSTCLPATECIQVVVLDTASDGLAEPGEYAITYGTEEPVSGNGSGWGCRLYQFGSGCANMFLSIPADCSFNPLDPSRDTINGSF